MANIAYGTVRFSARQKLFAETEVSCKKFFGKKKLMSKNNRQYKDSVFVNLFANDEKAKEWFLDLYNALHGT